MNTNSGKVFEEDFRKSCGTVVDVSTVRLLDPQAGYKSVGNICDFILYRKPIQVFIECKSYASHRIAFSAIRPTQWEGLIVKSRVPGVVAGVLFNFRPFGADPMAVFVPILELEKLADLEYKSITLPEALKLGTLLPATKRRVRYSYDVSAWLRQLEVCEEHARN